MIHGNFFPESPKHNSFGEITEEEALSKIFEHNVEQMEIQDEISLDSLYYLNKKPKKDLTPEKFNEDKTKGIAQNASPFLIMDDYESFYNIFADPKEKKK